MATTNGATLIARSLKQQGVDYMFGIVGFPVVPIAMAAQKAGITFIGMRNEQAASYAAQAAGYLTGRPQACLVVSGPGVIHALSGLANAQQNNWPMVLLGGANGLDQNGMGAFQEERQVAGHHAVHQVQPRGRATPTGSRSTSSRRCARRWYGRPGADLPRPARRRDPRPRSTRTTCAPAATIAAAAAQPGRPTATSRPPSTRCARAERPLVIVGKGMAWSRAEDEVRAVHRQDPAAVPRLADGQGRGVRRPPAVGRRGALATRCRNADLILLLGARLNWIMHFGLPPRFHPDVRVIQLDISAEQLSHNVPAEVGLVGDGKAVMAQLNAGPRRRRRGRTPADTPWRRSIADKIEANRGAIDGHGRRRLGADELLPRLPRHQGGDPARRHHRQRGRQHDGHRPHAAQQRTSRAPASTPAATARWASASASPSPRPWCSRTGRSCRCRATRPSASRAWSSRRSAGTTCRSRRSC